MKRRPQELQNKSILHRAHKVDRGADMGLVLSGGGARAAYQVGALKALVPFIGGDAHPITVVVGSSIGAINGLLFAACLKTGIDHAVSQLEALWIERTFRNTFAGSPSSAFFRAIRMAFVQYMSPGPNPSVDAVFDPSPLMARVDSVITEHGGLTPESRHPQLSAVAVMTTIEGTTRKPMLFLSSHKRIEPETLRGASFEVCYVDSLSAKHGFASAALPSVLPPVELDTEHGRVSLIDGGISQNVPVDPAVRMGSERVVLIDISGRNWWHDRYGHPHDRRPDWEVPADFETFCLRPPEAFVLRCQQPLGPILKAAVGSSTRRFMAAVGPIWPVFSLIKNKLGEEAAYEVMTYVALDHDYVVGIMERGFSETAAVLRDKREIEFRREEMEKLESGVASL